MNRALDAFRAAVLAAERSKYLYGFIGKLDSSASGGVVADVPGKPGYVYVRLFNGSEIQSVEEAYNAGGMLNPNILYRIERREGGLVIESPVASSAVSYLGAHASNAAIPPHTGSIESGNADMVEGRRFVPGLMRAAIGTGEPGGLYVYVEAFHYDGGYWPGGTFLMTVPATSGMKAWCVVALNPADGALYQFTGTEVALPAPLLEYDAAGITITNGYIPVGAVVLQNGQSTITGEEPWADLRYHLAQAGGDITGFVALTPDSDTRNTVQPAGDHPALILKNNASQTDAPLQVQNSSGNVLAQISAAGGLVVNEQGADADTRIEGDTDANLLFVDASTDRVGIGTNAPAQLLDVDGTAIIQTLMTDASTELTIVSGAVTVTQTFHRIDTEADAISDNLDTINGGVDGQFLVIRAENTAREVVVTTAGNITTSDGNNVSLDEVYKFLLLIYDGNRSKWSVVGGGGGGSGSYYQTVKDNGTPLTQRAALNLIGGTDISLTIADDAGNGETDVTIAFTGSGSGSTPYSLCQGRLTLTSGTAVTTSDVTAAGTVYFTPYRGDQVGLYTGAAWTMHTLSELSISLSGLLPHSIHDVFLDYNGGTPVLALNAWTAGATAAITGATNATPISITSDSHGLSTNDIVTISGVGGNTAANGTFRITNTGANTFTLQTLAGANVAGSGAYTSGGNWYKSNYVGTRATALTTQNGVYVLTGATDWRYLGTVRITGTAGQTEDSLTKRFVWNYAQRAIRALRRFETTNSWAYSTATLRWANNSASNQVEVIIGVAESVISLQLAILVQSSATSQTSSIAFGEDSSSTAGSNSSAMQNFSQSAIYLNLSVYLYMPPAIGYHYYAWLERGNGSGTQTWYALSSPNRTGGIAGSIDA